MIQRMVVAAAMRGLSFGVRALRTRASYRAIVAGNYWLRLLRSLQHSFIKGRVYAEKSHKLAFMPKGIKAGDLRRGCEGLDIWNSWGNYCAAPKSVGSQTMNEDSSRSQHGELTASRTGGTDQLNAHSELRIQILVRANSAEKVPDT